MKYTILLIFILVTVCSSVLAERQLTENEINEIFETLTATPADTWINHGTITAMHHEYKAPENADPKVIEEAISKAQSSFPEDDQRTPSMEMRYNAIPFNVTYELSNEYTMASIETVKYDGDRFYWEIDVQERNDSIKPAAMLQMARYFNMSANKKRIFAWDGQKYTTYFNPSNHAMVTEGATMRPVVVDGPLKAGIVPWGIGLYTYESLSSANCSATETEGKVELHISWDHQDVTFLLDPAMNYSVLASITQRGDNIFLCNYNGYNKIQGRWVPSVIVVDVCNADDFNNIKSRDIWEITVIDEMPSDESFAVNYEKDTLVEYHSEEINQSIQYRSSDITAGSRGYDSKMLLDLRINAEKYSSEYSQNCATVAMKSILTKYDLPIDDQELSLLVDETNGTSLYDLKEYVSQNGFFCKAVRTDIETLIELHDCEVMIYLAGSEHYVLLGEIDSKYVRLIDLTSRKIHYRISHSAFQQQWSDGVALLISIRDLDSQTNLQEIDETRLKNIIGRDDCTYGCYSCTELIQEFGIYYCPAMSGSMCGGQYEQFYERYAPKLGSSGTASGEGMVGALTSECIIDIYNPTLCSVSGLWYEHYIKACQ